MGKREKLGVDFFRDRQLLTTLTSGSDRDAAILCGSILEELLNRLLEKKLIQTGVFKDAIESSNGSLATFSNKIQICYLIGVISKRMYDNLKRTEGDNPTIGLILCSETSEDMARYSVLHDNDRLFQARYLTYLPSIEQLKEEIEIQKEIFRLQCEDETNKN